MNGFDPVFLVNGSSPMWAEGVGWIRGMVRLRHPASPEVVPERMACISGSFLAQYRTNSAVTPHAVCFYCSPVIVVMATANSMAISLRMSYERHGTLDYFSDLNCSEIIFVVPIL